MVGGFPHECGSQYACCDDLIKKGRHVQNCLEMFEFNENYACLKFNLYWIFTTHKYAFHTKNFINLMCKARVTTSVHYNIAATYHCKSWGHGPIAIETNRLLIKLHLNMLSL